jgi:hypothetical protein
MEWWSVAVLEWWSGGVVVPLKISYANFGREGAEEESGLGRMAFFDEHREVFPYSDS